MLEALCDNIDGSVSFITLFCCQAINIALQPGTGVVQSIEEVSERFYE